MRKYTGSLIVVCLTFLLVSCSSPKVITYAHASADFDRYQTFSINPHTEVSALSRKGHETFQRLDALIDELMSAKGYRYSENPDLIIDYEISSGLSQQTQNQYYDRYSYWYYPNYSYSSRPQDIEAMIEIEMIDAESKKTAWTGTADLTLRTRREGNIEKIEQHIVSIFDQFQYNAP